ncbi:hypothetical protein ES703_36116 [subsurface metagenome]
MNKRKFNRKSLKKGIRLFLFISFITITVILIFTVSEETKEGLKLISPLFLILTIISVFLRFLFDIWRVRYIAVAMGRELSWIGAFYFTLGGLFVYHFSYMFARVRAFHYQRVALPYLHVDCYRHSSSHF